MADSGDLCPRATGLIKAAGYEALRERGRFNLVLTGGGTVQPLYRHLAGQAFTPEFRKIWPGTDFFLGDERLVPEDHPDSNGGMVRRLLLAPAGISGDRIFLIPTGFADPRDGAAAYENILRGYFAGDHGDESDLPQFDLVLLSLGEDGHVASLFPGSEALREKERWLTVSSSPGAAPPLARITLTLPVLNRARLVVIMVIGEKKTALAREIVAKTPDAAPFYPAGMVNSADRIIWLLADKRIG
jgi:6-phosphogluconolactonase